MKRLVLTLTVAMIAACPAFAQEHGRVTLQGGGGDAGLGRGLLPLPQVGNHFFAGTWGFKLGLGWAMVDWDVGPVSGKERLFVPQASMFYRPNDDLEVNLSAMVFSASDRDALLGRTSADLARLNLGLRYWIRTQNRTLPFFGAGIGYYFVDADADRIPDPDSPDPLATLPANVSNVDDTPGGHLEAGISFQISDNFFINTELTYDFLLSSSKATLNGEADDVDLSVFAVNLAAMWFF